jgi:DNA-binding protein H-NS
MPIPKELQEEIDAKQSELDALRAKAAEAVKKSKEATIARIKELMKENEVTLEDLGGKSPEKKSSTLDKGVKAPKYRKGNDTWSGRGPRPRWIKTYLEENPGHALEDLLISDQ